MKTNLTLGSIALTTALLASPSIAQQNSADMTQKRIHNRIIELCNVPNIGDNIVGGVGEICEFSPDNGINWYKLGAGASILTLIGAGAIFRSKKRKEKIGKASDKDTSQKYNWEIDWKKWDVGDNSNSTAGDIDTDDGLDPIGEDIGDGDDRLDSIGDDILDTTDVFIAYGRFDNARDFLIEHIALDTENIELYIKLLEVYYRMQNKESFAMMYQGDIINYFGNRVSADDLAKMKKWGNEIDPDNTLYKIDNQQQTVEK